MAIEELIASAIYAQAKAAMVVVNQAESSAAENSVVRVVTRADDSTEKPNTELALYHLLRLGKLVPHSKYRVNAEFDAANLLLAEKQWSQAVPLLLAFQQRFPNHQYSSTIPAKLALSYENLGMWPKAAEQLLIMVTKETNPEIQREAKYTAAEYYLKAGDNTAAFIQYRDYAHQYPEPFSVAQEVRFKLSEFYRETNEPNKRYFWFRKIISFHKQKVATHQSDPAELARSTYLSSYAAFQLGQAHQQTFNYTKLKIPLNKSLKSKQSSMKEAINYYQLVFDWQLVEFVPQANYAIAEMYRKLAIDVMASEKPRDLDELALEEYDLLLEEIAYPFEEKSIAIHQENAKRAWQNIYDQSVKNSFKVLAEIEPAKYQKFETVPEVIDEIF